MDADNFACSLLMRKNSRLVEDLSGTPLTSRRLAVASVDVICESKNVLKV